MRHGKRKTLLNSFFIYSLLCLLCSCVTARTFSDGSPLVTAGTAYSKDGIRIMFAGDIMQHKPNYAYGNFDAIWEAVRSDISACSLAVANLETPVDASRPYDTYPNFNTHPEYVQAAIDAGFNVFSTANNHSNDQGLEGIQATRAYFEKLRKETKDSSRPIYESGLKDSSSSYSYEFIEKDGWKILFLAVTEILNRPSYSSYINYVEANGKARREFTSYLTRLREENPCDIFVLSFHCAEEEYVQAITGDHKKPYHDFLNAGVDVVLANHPHVAKDWELVQNAEKGTSKLIFYAMGNTISAQRTSPSFSAPDTNRDYTGEGYMAEVRFEKTLNGIRIANINPILITTYIRTDGMFVIKKLDDDFINYLRENGRSTWAKYMEERRTLMEKTKGILTWQ